MPHNTIMVKQRYLSSFRRVCDGDIREWRERRAPTPPHLNKCLLCLPTSPIFLFLGKCASHGKSDRIAEKTVHPQGSIKYQYSTPSFEDISSIWSKYLHCLRKHETKWSVSHIFGQTGTARAVFRAGQEEGTHHTSHAVKTQSNTNLLGRGWHLQMGQSQAWDFGDMWSSDRSSLTPCAPRALLAWPRAECGWNMSGKHIGQTDSGMFGKDQIPHQNRRHKYANMHKEQAELTSRFTIADHSQMTSHESFSRTF